MPTFSPAPPYLAPTLGAVILLFYAVSLWRLLRRDGTRPLWPLLTLCCLSLGLRLAFSNDYPHGLIEDEPKGLHFAALHGARSLFGENTIGIPGLLITIFETGLIPVFGPTKWAMRAYSMGTSVLAVPAMYGVARLVGLRTSASLAAAFFIAVLPWSIFYGRIGLGGELILHQLILLGALAAMIWGRSSWVDTVSAAFALALLYYDYYSGRALAGMVLVTVFLARTWRTRLQCLLILPLAFALWWPHFSMSTTNARVGTSSRNMHETVIADPVTAIRNRYELALKTLVTPTAWDGSWTVRAAAMHPPLILGLALIGAFTGFRRALFLWAGFLGCLLPAVVSTGMSISTHRMMNAFPFIALAAACALNLIPWRWPRLLVTVGAASWIGAQSVLHYFSPTFWSPSTRITFDWERSDIVEEISRSSRRPLVVDLHLGFFFLPQVVIEPDYQVLAAEKWIPPASGGTYVFGWHYGALLPTYQRLFGARVRAAGRAFLVEFEPRDWSWLGRNGWHYEAQCGNERRDAAIPFLYSRNVGFTGFFCREAMVHRWEARWNGSPALLRFSFTGSATIENSNGSVVELSGFEQSLDFRVASGDDVRITLTTIPPDNSTMAAVTRVHPGLGPRETMIPNWEDLSPISFAPPLVGPPEPPAELAQG